MYPFRTVRDDYGSFFLRCKVESEETSSKNGVAPGFLNPALAEINPSGVTPSFTLYMLD
jgi:hypothetical protein